MKEKDISLFRYRGDLTKILQYQVLSKAVFLGVMQLFRWVTGLLLWNLGRPSFTSGDLPYLMRSWQGWLLILAGFLVLVVYVVFDINAMILLSDKLLKDQPVKVLSILKEAVWKAGNFKSGWGIVVVIYAALIAPLTGVSLGITLTSTFVIPEFILSVINANLILRILYNLVLVLLGILGFFHVLTFHYAILGNKKIKDALKESRTVMRKKWLDFLKRYILFAIKDALILAVLGIVLYTVPSFILKHLPVSDFVYHTAIIFITILYGIVMALAAPLYLHFLMMKLTIIYHSYADPEKQMYITPKKHHHKIAWTVSIFSVILGLLLSVVLASDFDTIFPRKSAVKIIAHRAGGTLANENTIVGLEAAIAKEVYGAEIDVQRTKDGHYIINHDNDFSRCCDEPRTPGEMTLEEIKQLQVKDANHPFEPGAEVATIEEFLDAAKDRVFLYIELKGPSANMTMAEDVYQMIKDRGMEDGFMFISLDYNLINSIETAHPEIQTGYLCFFSFGDIGTMNCDVLLLEAETATQENVDRIHETGKEVNVWTVDSFDGLVSFMTSDVDGIITDEINMVDAVRDFLENEGDAARLFRYLVP